MSSTPSRFRIGLSLLIAFSIIGLEYSPAISGAVYAGLNPTVKWPTSPLANPQTWPLHAYSLQRTQVTDYSADVILVFQQRLVIVGDNVTIHIEVKNTGTVTPQAPYYYVILTNPQNQSFVTIPGFFGGASFYTYSSKPSAYTSTPPILAGTSSLGPIRFWYSWTSRIPKDATSEGTWTVYIFLYDSPYVDRTGNKLPIQPDSAYAFAFDIFQVAPMQRSQGGEISQYSLSAVSTVSAVVAFVLTYLKIAPWVERHENDIRLWRRRNTGLIAGMIAVIVLNILFWLTLRG